MVNSVKLNNSSSKKKLFCKIIFNFSLILLICKISAQDLNAQSYHPGYNSEPSLNENNESIEKNSEEEISYPKTFPDNNQKNVEPILNQDSYPSNNTNFDSSNKDSAQKSTTEILQEILETTQETRKKLQENEKKLEVLIDSTTTEAKEEIIQTSDANSLLIPKSETKEYFEQSSSNSTSGPLDEHGNNLDNRIVSSSVEPNNLKTRATIEKSKNSSLSTQLQQGKFSSNP